MLCGIISLPIMALMFGSVVEKDKRRVLTRRKDVAKDCRTGRVVASRDGRSGTASSQALLWVMDCDRAIEATAVVLT